jgi:VIT1/CCC1 family predicted Fe2+/Mn2+ transporter
MFLVWGGYSLGVLINMPNWTYPNAPYVEEILPQIHFGYTMSAIVWLVFSSIFVIIAYATLKPDKWVWTTSLIISTIFLAIFGLMLASFIINVLTYFSEFSVLGLVTTIITFIIDLGIIFFLTRPKNKLYFP